MGTAVCTDTLGNIYGAGIFKGLIDVDPDSAYHMMYNPALLGQGRNAPLNYDGYIVKYDSSGTLIWARELNCGHDIRISDMKLDHSGNIILGGYYQYGVDLDPMESVKKAVGDTSGHYNGFVAKYTKGGRLMWKRNIGGQLTDKVHSISIDERNNVYVGGRFSDSVDFDPGRCTDLHISNGKEDAFILKYNSRGEYLWVKCFGGPGDDHVQDIALTGINRYTVTGMFSDSVSIDSQMLKAAGLQDIFIARFDNKRKVQWVQSMGGSREDSCAGIIISKTGSIYISGTFGGAANFDPDTSSHTLKSQGSRDIFLAKYWSNGSLAWARGFKGSDHESAHDHIVDDRGGIYLTGAFTGTVNFDPSSTSHKMTAGSNDMFVAKHDSNGSHVWSFQLGWGKYETKTVLELDNFGKLWLGGGFNRLIDFDHGPGTAEFGNWEYRNKNSFFAAYNPNNGAYYQKAMTFHPRIVNSDWAQFMKHDSKGNLLLISKISGIVDFDPDTAQSRYLSGKGVSWNYVITKYDSLGKHVWSSSIKCGRINYVTHLTIDDSDNIYIAGETRDSVDIDPSSNTLWVYDGGYVVKYDPNGNYLWHYAIDQPMGGVSIDHSGGIWCYGSFKGTSDFDPGPGKALLTANSLSRSLFLCRFNRKGQFLFVKGILSDANASTSTGVSAIGADNSIYLGGWFDDQTDFDPGPNSAKISATAKRAAFIAKYDSLGRYIWARALDGTSSSLCHISSIDIDDAENLYTAGVFEGQIDFDMGTSTNYITSAGATDAFVMKCSSTGQSKWTHTFGSTDVDAISELTVNGDIITMSGEFTDTVDFNSSTTGDSILVGKNWGDVFILRLDTSAAFDEVAHVAVMFNVNWKFSRPWSFHIPMSTYRSETVIAGMIRGTADFDPGPCKAHYSSLNYPNIFLAYYDEMAPCVPCKPTFDSFAVTTCGPYRSPGGRTFYHVSGIYHDTLVNQMGCDSFLTIKLTINNSFGSMSPTVCDSFKTPSGKVLYRSGMYCDTIKNKIGCDSVIKINLSVLGKSSTRVNLTTCDSVLSPSGKFYMHTTAIYRDTLVSSLGCDSLLRINFKRLKPSYSAPVFTSCDSVVSPSSKYVYTTPGRYYDTIPNTIGCDSVIELTVKIGKQTRDTIEVSTCDSLFNSIGNYYISKSGVYIDTMKSKLGCDSLFITKAKIVKLNPVIRFTNDSLIIDSAGLSYQWLDCNNNYAKIDSATKQFYIPKKSGKYAVQISTDSCADTSICMEVVVVGKPGHGDNGITLFPNPAREEVLLSGSDLAPGMYLDVYSLTGQWIMTGTVNGYTQKLKVGELSPGIYYLHIRGNNTIRQLRFVKE